MNNREQILNILFVLFISEIPTLFFTILDFLKLKSIEKYQIRYNNSRGYPTNKEIIHALKTSYTKFTKIYIIPLLLMYIFNASISFLSAIDINKSFISYVLDFIFVSILCDVCLYFTHRLFHKSNYLYQKFHIKHHKKYEPTFSAIHYVFLFGTSGFQSFPLWVVATGFP